MNNRLTRFWRLIEFQEQFDAAVGEALSRDTSGLIAAYADPEDGTVEFLFNRNPLRPCRAGADARKHLARELRRLAERCAQAASQLEERDHAP
jgi:hypothetical protein